MEPTAEQYKAILRRYLPAAAVDTLYDFLNSHAVYLHITRQRSSKLGDYRMPQPRHPGHEISVNGDLNPYLFLWVLLHEMAHLNTYLHYGRNPQPHGHEWQQQYALLLNEYNSCFPAEAQPLIARYAAHLPLNRALGRDIERLFAHYNRGYNPAADIRLKELPLGSCFYIDQHPGRLFRMEEKRRTRYRCTELNSNRQYLVSGEAPVHPVERP